MDLYRNRHKTILFVSFSYSSCSISYNIVRYRIKFIPCYLITLIYNINRYGQWRATHTSAIPCYISCSTFCYSCATTSTFCTTAAPPAQPVVPPVPPGPMPLLNWFHFKPEFLATRWRCRSTSSLDKWLDGHPCISRRCKLQRFSLTLVGEARLWYESLRHIALDWKGLQNQWRQQ